MVGVIKNITNSIKYWYILLIVGVLFIVLGVYIFTVPLEAYITISFLFALSFIISGIIDTLFAIINRDLLISWVWYLLGGLLSLFIGIYLINHPSISQLVLSLSIGFILLFRSGELFLIAIDFKKLGIDKWLYIVIISILGMILSILLILNPLISSISIVILTGLSLISVGFSAILLSLSLRKLKNIPSKFQLNI